ncbi:Eco57I restriction-modification methylase [Tessaracoccus bendigoensis DSM 12906]|uniref:Eco57I restriction-modification methylase n=1 Tax=Tessaracoccus bendigoensis DSM 12906 TaxID=1123357 RepID=A0A1M6G8S0_9ACTN|nr:Eco57I restriction-modification methylase domain-containing protein [Tessaracoccus bendigoensis]SHJ06385.1 Eco57I restriction-modification methylase [Tessaracoccus bendigoensis DSM 12906]
MTKKFDVVIGNPPYQEDSETAPNRREPLYPKFMDAAFEVGEKAVLITPARFLSNSGQTKAAWNKKMLADKHLQVAYHAPDSSSLFPGTDIKGGIAVTYRDSAQEIGPIGTFLGGATTGMASVIGKVDARGEESFYKIVSSRALYRYSDLAIAERSEITDVVPKGAGNQVTPSSFIALDEVIFFDAEPSDGRDYVQVVGSSASKRTIRWLRSDYISAPDSRSRFKVLVAKANNSGAFGETLSSPFVAGPGVTHTDTFLTVGPFDSDQEAEACLAYLKTKFARALLSVLKTTQNNARSVWKLIPLQDFTSSSDIDWTKPIPEIDQQLYAKYGLDTEEIAFIEDNVKPMA